MMMSWRNVSNDANEIVTVVSRPIGRGELCDLTGLKNNCRISAPASCYMRGVYSTYGIVEVENGWTPCWTIMCPIQIHYTISQGGKPVH
ncbi:hypothetical protein PENTCL1PPCAC_22297 [Pristionchus entomophagus]|uniref:Uncharacterized protein n=1 Tax=Pristionchus entomophagus TaxID=358040 RepID=A0AAV5U0I2_9BILA|nr:hypothetical protein PENTCL1PPCAC_22297 [Pristionchus entomophagus]